MLSKFNAVSYILCYTCLTSAFSNTYAQNQLIKIPPSAIKLSGKICSVMEYNYRSRMINKDVANSSYNCYESKSMPQKFMTQIMSNAINSGNTFLGAQNAKEGDMIVQTMTWYDESGLLSTNFVWKPGVDDIKVLIST